MNLFCVNEEPDLAAKSLCGRHIVKMPSETAMLLNNCFGQFNDKGKQKAYYNHPVSVWTRKTKENFNWAVKHGLALCEEYSRRYKRKHGSQDFIEYAQQQGKVLSFAESGLTEFARCFSEFKSILDSTQPNTIEAYRSFYWLDKKLFAKWPSIRDIPNWWPDISSDYVDKAFVGGEYSRR